MSICPSKLMKRLDTRLPEQRKVTISVPTSNSKLKEVYEEIDKLEKTKLNVKEYSKRQEEYRWFALAAFLCVLLEVLLRNSILKKIP